MINRIFQSIILLLIFGNVTYSQNDIDSLIYIQKGAFYGGINSEGKTIIPFIYDSLKLSNENVLIAYSSSGSSIYSENCNLLFNEKFAKIVSSDIGLWLSKDNTSYSYSSKGTLSHPFAVNSIKSINRNRFLLTTSKGQQIYDSLQTPLLTSFYDSIFALNDSVFIVKSLTNNRINLCKIGQDKIEEFTYNKYYIFDNNRKIFLYTQKNGAVADITSPELKYKEIALSEFRYNSEFFLGSNFFYMDSSAVQMYLHLESFFTSSSVGEIKLINDTTTIINLDDKWYFSFNNALLETNTTILPEVTFPYHKNFIAYTLENDSVWNLLHKSGKLLPRITEVLYNFPINFPYAEIISNKNRGVISESGEIILPTVYHKIELFKDKIKAYRGNKLLILDLNKQYKIIDRQEYTLSTSLELNSLNMLNSDPFVLQNKVIKVSKDGWQFNLANSRYFYKNIAGDTLLPPIFGSPTITVDSKNWAKAGSFSVLIDTTEGVFRPIKLPKLYRFHIEDFKDHTIARGVITNAMNEPIESKKSRKDLPGYILVTSKGKTQTIFKESTSSRNIYATKNAIANYISPLVNDHATFATSGYFREVYETLNYIYKNKHSYTKKDVLNCSYFNDTMDYKCQHIHEEMLNIFLSKLEYPDRSRSYYLIRNAKWGILNTKGKCVVPSKYTYLSSFNKEGVCVFQEDQKYGLLSKEGSVVLKNEYDFISMIEGDSSAFIIHDTKLKWALIDTSGNYILESKYQEIHQKHDNIIKLKINDSIYYYHTERKKIITDGFKQGESFSEGYAAVKKNKMWGYIDTNGKYVSDTLFIEASSFSNGLARVRDRNGCYYINNTFKNAFSQFYQKNSDFLKGYAIVSQGNFRLINSKGERVFKNKNLYFSSLKELGPYIFISPSIRSNLAFILNPVTNKIIYKDRVNYDTYFKDGNHSGFVLYKYIDYKKKYGIIDTEGKIVLPFIYEYVSRPYNGTMIVVEDFSEIKSILEIRDIKHKEYEDYIAVYPEMYKAPVVQIMDYDSKKIINSGISVYLFKNGNYMIGDSLYKPKANEVLPGDKYHYKELNDNYFVSYTCDSLYLYKDICRHTDGICHRTGIKNLVNISNTMYAVMNTSSNTYDNYPEYHNFLNNNSQIYITYDRIYDSKNLLKFNHYIKIGESGNLIEKDKQLSIKSHELGTLILKGRTYGLCSANGTIILPPIYDEITLLPNSSKKYYLIRKDTQYFLLDEQYKQIELETNRAEE